MVGNIVKEREWIYVRIVSDTNSFSRRNAEQIPRKYDKFEGMSLEIADSQGVLLATQSEMQMYYL